MDKTFNDSIIAIINSGSDLAFRKIPQFKNAKGRWIKIYEAKLKETYASVLGDILIEATRLKIKGYPALSENFIGVLGEIALADPCQKTTWETLQKKFIL